MIKLFSIFVVLCVICIAPFQKSNIPDYTINVHSRSDIYNSIKKEHNIAFRTCIFVATHFKIISKYLNLGEYIVYHNDTAFDLLCRMMKGDFIVRKIVIPEGYTVKMIVEKVKDDKFLIGDIGEIPEEGTLYPATYYYKRDTKRSDLIDRMKVKMNIVKQELFKGQNEAFIKKIMIIASIIEKETNIDAERPIIASVIYNRLNHNMKLQVDPTVIYALSNGYGKIERALLRSDLLIESPYNTYKVKGLPPTPICCPSIKSIEAALYPAKTNNLYFIVDKDKKHHNFSETYSQHLYFKNRK